MKPSDPQDIGTPTDDRKSSGNSKPYRKQLSKILTNLSHLSTPFITTFLLIHLSAPALANLGGSSLSSQVMVRPFSPVFAESIDRN